MAFINGHIIRKMFHMSLETCHATELSSSRKQIGSFSFFLLKKQQCVVEQQLYWISQEKNIICLLGSVTLIDTIPKSLNHFVGKCALWGNAARGENYKQIKVGRELRTLTHVLAVRKTWKLSLKDITGWSEILLTNLLSAICRDFKNSGANRSKCFVNECFSGSGWKDNKSQ